MNSPVAALLSATPFNGHSYLTIPLPIPMKPQLIIFAVLIAGFIIYNLFFQLQDDRMNTIINIALASILFGYISFMAYSLLKKMKK